MPNVGDRGEYGGKIYVFAGDRWVPEERAQSAQPKQSGILDSISQFFDTPVGQAIKYATPTGVPIASTVQHAAKNADKGLWGMLTAPSVDVGAAKLEDYVDNPTAKGVVQGVQDFVGGMTSPLNVGLLVGTGGLSKIINNPVTRSAVQRLMSGGFSLDMIHSAAKEVPEILKAVESGDYQAAARLLVQAGASGAAGVAAGVHALKGGRVAKVEPKTEEAAADAAKPAGTPAEPIPEKIPTVSPSYDETKPTFVARNEPELQPVMAEATKGFEARNTEREVVSIPTIQEYARKLDPQVVADLDVKKLRELEVLDPQVVLRARQEWNTVAENLARREADLQKNRELLPPEEFEKAQTEIDLLRKEEERLGDVVLPVRSNIGRSLRYLGITAGKMGFDADYWLAQARRRNGNAPIPDDVRRTIREAILKGKEAEAAGDTKGMEDSTKTLASTVGKLQKSGVGESLLTLWKAGLLTNPVTHAVNVASNTAHQALMLTERIPASLADVVWTMFSRGDRAVAAPSIREIGRAMGESVARIKRGDNGLEFQAGSGIKRAGQVLKQGVPDEYLAKGDVQAEKTLGLEGIIGTRANKVLDTYAKGVFRSLSAEDQVARAAAMRSALDEQAVLIAKNELRSGKIKKSEYSDRVKELQEKPTGDMSAQAIWMAESAGMEKTAILKRVKDTAEYATFTKSNILSRELVDKPKASLRTKGDAGKAAAAAYDVTVPFSTTPANVFQSVIERTPAGAAIRVGWEIRKGLKGGFKPEQQRAISLAIGRGLTGSALMYAGAKLYQDGNFIPWQEDEGIRNLRQAEGIRPGSVRLNGKWYPVDRYSPAGILLTTGATLMADSVTPQKGITTDSQKAYATMGRLMLEQPMLKGVSDKIDAIKNPNKATNLIGSTVSSIVPSIVNAIGAATDDGQRDIRSNTFSGGIANAVTQRIPGIRESLPYRSDALGRTVKDQPMQVLGTTQSDDPVLRELINENVGIAKPNRRADRVREVIPDRQQAQVLLKSLRSNGWDVRLESENGKPVVTGLRAEPIEELQLRERLNGAVIRKILAETINSPAYQQLAGKAKGDEARSRILKEITSKASRYVNEGVTGSPLYKYGSPADRMTILTKLLQGFQ